MPRDKAQPLLEQREAQAAAAQPPSGRAEIMPACRDTGNSWEAFHQQHASGRFFRPKRYLTEEFPQLVAPGIHILDIGAGNGASVIPILIKNVSARATCCDVSSIALRLLQASAGKLLCSTVVGKLPRVCLLLLCCLLTLSHPCLRARQQAVQFAVSSRMQMILASPTAG
jgi:hypothetical protein